MFKKEKNNKKISSSIYLNKPRFHAVRVQKKIGTILSLLGQKGHFLSYYWLVVNHGMLKKTEKHCSNASGSHLDIGAMHLNPVWHASQQTQVGNANARFQSSATHKCAWNKSTKQWDLMGVWMTRRLRPLGAILIFPSARRQMLLIALIKWATGCGRWCACLLGAWDVEIFLNTDDTHRASLGD